MGARGPHTGMPTTAHAATLAREILAEWPGGGIAAGPLLWCQCKDDDLLACISASEEEANITKYGNGHCEKVNVLCKVVLSMTKWQRRWFFRKIHGLGKAPMSPIM